MGQLRHFDRYLENLKKRRDNDPFQPQAKRVISNASNQYKQDMDKMDADLSRNGMPAGVNVQSRISAAKGFNQNAANIYSEADSKNLQRKDQLNNKIDETEFARDQAKEELNKQKAEQKKGWWQSGGALLGGAAALVTGGAALPFMAAGAGLGQVAGEIDSGEYMNSQGLMQGLGDTIGAVAEGFSLKKDKAFGNLLKDNIGVIQGMDVKDLNILKIFMQSGDTEALGSFFNNRTDTGANETVANEVFNRDFPLMQY